MSLTLVVLAAGIGSRFGGTKQLAEVGPSGEAILDYTIFDAHRAGFDRLVLIVRSDLVELVRAHLGRHHGAALRYELVLQDRFGPPRAKPWGTGHAVLAAAPAVPGPFGVVNADDFYGAEAFAELADALRGAHPPARPAPLASGAGAASPEPGGPPVVHHLIAYRLAQTLSELGPVSRGICDVGPDGRLRSIVENLAIERDAAGVIVSRGSGAQLPDDALVSMNLWGLQPSVFDALRTGWERFQAEQGPDATAEFLLPAVIGDLVSSGRAAVAVHATDATWLGVTYPGDLPAARDRLAALVAAGTYPTPLRQA